MFDKAAVTWRTWAVALAGLAAATLTLYVLRASLDKAHIVIVLLLVVLLGSAAGGRALGLVLAVLGFLAFDLWFLPPYNTLVVADPLDWLVLLAFLATGVVAAQLLARAQREARRANARAQEVDRLASLGSETLSVAKADDALLAIARVTANTLGVSQCHLFPVLTPEGNVGEAIPRGAETGEMVIWVAVHGVMVWTLMDGTTRTEAPRGSPANVPAVARALYVPLRVRDRTVGVMHLVDATGISLDPTRQRYLDALAHYAALGLERLRLTGEAEHAEALREADRLKDALMATVSHDLRTPLTTIRGLAHDIASEGDERAYVIEDEVIRLNALVTDLLDLSRLNAGGIPLNLAYNTADELMGAALQMVGGAALQRDIRATIDPAEPLLVGRFDLAHSVRIIGNLLDNAIKYSPIDEPIDFTVRRDEAMLVFEVADRGRGVPESERERIFAPFHRAPSERPDVGGTGLGLAIAKGLADAQQGTLTCTPRAGGGSVFTLRLPAADLSTDFA